MLKKLDIIIAIPTPVWNSLFKKSGHSKKSFGWEKKVVKYGIFGKNLIFFPFCKIAESS
jgi:hypothetical protein